jgi:transposase-like protein
MEEKRKGQKRRRFTPEYKAEAVRLVETSHRTCAEVARDLGIQATSLRAWVEQARIDVGKGVPDALTTEERKELGALRKENRVLKEEREVLKKAAAFFARENR